MLQSQPEQETVVVLVEWGGFTLQLLADNRSVYRGEEYVFLLSTIPLSEHGEGEAICMST